MTTIPTPDKGCDSRGLEVVTAAVLCSEMVNILGVALSSSRCGLMIPVWHCNCWKSYSTELLESDYTYTIQIIQRLFFMNNFVKVLQGV